MRDITLEDTFYHDFTTRAFASGVPTVLSGTPVLSVIEENNATPITAGVSVSVDRASVVGLNEATIVATAANGYELGKNYSIYISTGTVDSVSVVGEVVGQFTVASSAAAVSLAAGVDVISVLGDATSATGMRDGWNGTGITGDNYPSTQTQVGNIASGSAAQGQNATGATITTGTQTLTYTATTAADEVLHEIAASGGNTDFYYTTTLPGNGVLTGVLWRGYVQANGDSADGQFWDWVAGAYVTELTLSGSNSTTLIDETITAVNSYTGTGANIGDIRFRFLSTTTTNIATDRLVFEYTTVAAESGFENGMVWIDTDNGTAGTEKGIGIATNPSSNLADAITIASNNNLHQFYMTPNSTFAPTGDFNNYNVYGIGYTCTLGGHDYAGTHIYHASPVNGIATSVNNADHFDLLDSIVADVTVDDSHFTNCSFTSTITLGAVNSNVRLINCRSVVAGASTPILDFGTGSANHNVTIANYQNGIEVRNFNVTTTGGTDLFSMSGTGQVVIASTCDGGQMNLRGQWKKTDNSGGAVTFAYDDVASDVIDTLADTAEIGTAGAGLTDLGGMSTAMKAEVNTEADTALTDYDGPTNTELIARTILAAAYFDPAADTVATVTDVTNGVTLSASATSAQLVDDVWDEVLTGATHNISTSAGKRLRQLADVVIVDGTSPDTGGTANTAIRMELDSAASAVDGTYDPAVIVIVLGTGAGQSRQVFEYDGANKYAYINRDWKVIPDNTSEYIILANAGDTHVNEGVATGGGASTITLNTLASSVDDTYVGQNVFLFAGTGQDQSRSITAYNGTTKVATVARAWETNPASGATVYGILPTGDPTTLDAKIDIIDANVDQIETAVITNAAGVDISADIAAVKVDTAAVLVDTDVTIPALIAALNDLSTTDIETIVIETGYTLKQTLQLIAAATASKLSGAATNTNTIRSLDDSADRITATVDSDGNRSAVTHNV